MSDQLHPTEELRRPVDATKSSWRPWTASDLRWLARDHGWPETQIDGALLHDEESWRHFLERASHSQLAALHRRLGADPVEDEADQPDDGGRP
jgi:hypothetical protein